MEKCLYCALASLLIVFTPACAHQTHNVDCRKIVAQASTFIKTFDTNGDGKLNRQEWSRYETLLRQRALQFQRQHGLLPPNPEDINRMFDEYDRDGDGEITLDELTGNTCPQTAH